MENELFREVQTLFALMWKARGKADAFEMSACWLRDDLAEYGAIPVVLLENPE